MTVPKRGPLSLCLGWVAVLLSTLR